MSLFASNTDLHIFDLSFLQDYVQFYYDSYHVELESELSWPLERLVNY